MFKHNYSILLVDDENCARKLIEKRISKIPEVTLAASLSNGLSAQQYLQEHVVDIILTDINMPLMDGLELAAFVQKMNLSCPIIIISGYEEFEYARKAIRYGVKEYLLKPLNFEQIVEVVERYCREVGARREKLLLPQYNVHEDLERRLYRTFIKGEDANCWITDLEQLMHYKGTVVRIEPKATCTRKKEELSAYYKNILNEALPGQTVLRLGYTQDKYEYLVIQQKPEQYRLLKAIPEYLDRILEVSVIWTEVSVVESAQELALLSQTIKKDENEQIRAACRYMEENLGKMITRDEVADYIWLSPSYFSHLFKQTMGIGYNEYLTELRIRRAKRMLVQNVSISDIAVSIGFQDARYFSNIFRKKTGYTPSEYRQALLNGEMLWEEN